MFHILVASTVARLFNGHKGKSLPCLPGSMVTTIRLVIKSCYSHDWNAFSWWPSSILNAEHRALFTDISLMLWGSPRLFTAYFTLLLIRPSPSPAYWQLSVLPYTEHSASTSPALPDCVWRMGCWCPWRLDSLWHCNCCRGNWFCLVQIQELKVQSLQINKALNDALPPQSFLQGHRELTLLAAISVWAHHINPSYSVL